MGVWPCGRVGVYLVVGWAMRSVQKTTFSTECFDWIRQSEFSVKKSSVEKALFRLRKKARFGIQSKTAVFD